MAFEKKPIKEKVAIDKADKRKELVKQLEEEELRKDIACQDELNAVLLKYGRSLLPSVKFTMGSAPEWGMSLRRTPAKP